MQEIKIANKAGLKVYINGVANIKNIPSEITKCFISFLEQKIFELN